MTCDFCGNPDSYQLICGKCHMSHCRACACRSTLPSTPLFVPVLNHPSGDTPALPEQPADPPDVQSDFTTQPSPTLATGPSQASYYGALLSAFVLGAFMMYDTYQAHGAEDQFARAGKYKRGIRVVDSVLSQSVTTMARAKDRETELMKLVYRQLMGFTVGGPKVGWEVAKMVFNPRPMPLNNIWPNYANFVQTVRLMAYFSFANTEHISALLKDLMPLTHVEARNASASLATCRRNLFRGGFAGLAGGGLSGMFATSLVPGLSAVTGLLMPLNVYLFGNTFVKTVAKSHDFMLANGPHASRTITKHVDTFLKTEGPVLALRSFATVKIVSIIYVCQRQIRSWHEKTSK